MIEPGKETDFLSKHCKKSINFMKYMNVCIYLKIKGFEKLLPKLKKFGLSFCLNISDHLFN